MLNLTFKEYIFVMEQSKSLKDCNFIKCPKLRAECKKLHKKTKGNITFGGGPVGGSS